MKKSTMFRSLLLSGLSMLLCVSMLMGSTFAWFTDTVESGINTIVAGNLDVELYNGLDKTASKVNTSTMLFDIDLWEPGAMVYENLTVANEGTLALKYALSVKFANATTNANGDTLAKVLKVAVVPGGIADSTDRATLEALTTYQPLASFSETETLLAGESDVYGIVIWWQPSDIDNEFNMNNENKGKVMSIDLGISLFATQVESEGDSFGNDYDADASLIFTSNAIVLPAAGNVATESETLSTADETALTLTLSADFINALAQSGSSIQTVSLYHSELKTDDTNNSNAVKFDAVELIDQDGNVIDLDAMGNDEPIGVSLSVGNAFDEGDVVFIYHGGEYLDRATVSADGTISYEANHFCEVVITDTMTVKVNTAEDLLEALNDIKTEAKKQIPGENGNKQYRENAVFILENDISIDSADSFMYTDSNGAAFHFYGVNAVLDLNGHSITVTENALLGGKAYSNAVLLIQYANVDIIGEGSIIAKNKSIPVYAWANCTVDIYGGNYVTNAYERNESAVYVNNTSASVNVYGGTYMDSAYAFNVHDNCGSTTVITLHEGISYADFLKNGTTDVTQSDLNNGRIVVAEGCEIVKSEGINTVVKK